MSSANAIKYKIDDGHEFNFWGFAQFTAEARDDKANDGLNFGNDRARAGVRWKRENLFAGLHVDLNNTGDAPNETLDRFIRDAFGGYKFSNAAKVKIGQFKTPVGMSYNMPGKKLPLTKRPLTDRYNLDRTLGIMLSGRKIGGGFGYDIGIFNPASRAAQVSDSPADQGGDANAFAVRAIYDFGKAFYIEASYGSSEEAGGTVGSEDYRVVDVGAIYNNPNFRVRIEFIDAMDIRGVKNQNATTYFLEGSYKANKTYELTVRYENSDAETTGSDTNLQNTFLGVTVFLDSSTNGRIQLNYVTSSGDEATFPGFGGGFRDDAILSQYQVAF